MLMQKSEQPVQEADGAPRSVALAAPKVGTEIGALDLRLDDLGEPNVCVRQRRCEFLLQLEELPIHIPQPTSRDDDADQNENRR